MLLPQELDRKLRIAERDEASLVVRDCSLPFTQDLGRFVEQVVGIPFCVGDSQERRPQSWVDRRVHEGLRIAALEPDARKSGSPFRSYTVVPARATRAP